MKKLFAVVVGLGLAQAALAQAALAQAALAQAQAGAPAGSNGICKDGSYSTAASKDGACRGHKGVQTWYAAPVAKTSAAKPSASSPAASSAKTAPAAAPAPAMAAKPAPQPAPMSAAPAPMAARPMPSAPAATASAPASTAAAPKRSGPAAAAAAKPQAAGGGPGMVWVNTASNVYHCPGTDYYGKTKAGSYMSEADAKAKGARADRGKACTQ